MERVDLPSGKQVLLSDQFQPRTDMGKLVGRNREMEAIYAAWICSSKHPPLAPLLVGDPGVGKNRIVYELSTETGLPLYILQGHEDISAEDLACSVRFADGSRDKMDYVLSALVTAMCKGGICFIDEIGKIRPRALALLVSVLDERRYIDSTLLGERIKAHNAFRFVAATNVGEERELPEFIRSRMQPVVHMERPSDADINDIISVHLHAPTNLGGLLEEFWKHWKDTNKPTPRQAVQLFALASSFACHQKIGKELTKAQPMPIQVEDVKRAFEELHGSTEIGSGT
jgi:MoxR-like ATPase